MINSVDFHGVPSTGVIYEPPIEKSNVGECRTCEPGQSTRQCITRDKCLDENTWTTDYRKNLGVCNSVPHEWNWPYKNCSTMHDPLPPNLKDPWEKINDPDYKFRTTTGSTHNTKYYHPDLYNERRPKARPAGDMLYLDSLHLKLQALSGRVPLNTQTRKSEYKDKYMDMPESFPKVESAYNEYLKDLDTLPNLKENKSVFHKEDRDIPFSGLSKHNNDLSVTKLLDPYNSVYSLAYKRYSQQERQRYRPQDFKEDAIPADKPKVENLPIYGPDKEKVMKDPAPFKERRHYNPDELWPHEPDRKSVIQLPCIAYKTEYNSKYKDHPQLIEITHAGEVQPCCQQKCDHVVKKVEPAIQLDQRIPKRYITESMEVSGGKQFGKKYTKCDDCYCGNAASERPPYHLKE